ncbi:MAG: hypothetical protein CSB44_01525 [Gammaproteobacteria bacterium]|nr:MAG: hypothetical protein CSB44_01525 [Gammaproteobacteria bacterium]
MASPGGRTVSPDEFGVREMTMLMSRQAGFGLVGSVAVGLLLACAMPGGQARADEEDTAAAGVYAQERARFDEALEALAADDLERFETLRASLAGYPLADYLWFRELDHEWRRRPPEKADIGELNRFERETGHESMTRRLTQLMQRRLAEEENWPLFLGVSKSALASEMPCSQLRARFELGRVKGFDDAVLIDLWTAPEKPHERCSGVIDGIEAAHAPPLTAIWERIYQAMEANRPERAESVLHYLGSHDRRLIKAWMAATDDPPAFLLGGALDEDTPLNRRILADVVLEWSRQDTLAAMDYWQNYRSNYRFFDDRYYDTQRALALRAAWRRMPEASAWLAEIEPREDDLELMEWRIRAALLAGNWSAAVRGIHQLPLEERREDHWAYWEARALEVAGQHSAANEIYAELAELQSYHGFLAAEHIGRPHAIRNELPAVSPGVQAAVGSDKALLRAREFHYVGLPEESRREWNNWVLDEVDERSRLEAAAPPEELSGIWVKRMSTEPMDVHSERLAAAALVADEWGLHDRAIYAAGKAGDGARRAIAIRFPLLHRSEVANAAFEAGIDPAWVFAVMRRESAFTPDVHSHAGAVGLMQLMPRTAHYVAELHGDDNWQGDLTDPATNIGLGSGYLRHVMDRFDNHQVLATASYNAGPHRADAWLQPEPVEADVWIDTIPFDETRNYVRAVLAYAAIYEQQLTGKSTPIRNKLQPIPAAETEEKEAS